MELETEDKEVVLDERLVDLLESKGTTPFEEETLFNLFNTKESRTKIIKEAFKDSELKPEEFKAEQIGAFYHFLIKRITDLKNKEGYFKETERTKNINLPNYFETQEILDLAGDVSKAEKSLFKGKSKKELNDALFNRMFEIAKVDKGELSTWEYNLVVAQIQECAIGANNASLGMHVKNL